MRLPFLASITVILLLSPGLSAANPPAPDEEMDAGEIVDHMISEFQRARPRSQAYFWRTARGHEVDLLMDHGSRQVPFEIKLRSAPTLEDARGVLACMADLGLPRGYVIHPGREQYSLGSHVTALPAERLLRRLEDVAAL